MRLRTLLLVPAIGLLLAPAGAVAAGQTPSAAGYSAADIPGLVGSVTGPAARVGGFAAGSAAPSGTAADSTVPSGTAACTTGGVVTAADCAAVQRTGCAVGDVARDAGSQAAGSAIMTAYERDRYGVYRYDGYLNATVLDQTAIGAGSVALGTRTASGAAQLPATSELQLSRVVASEAPTVRAACLPNPCLATTSRATPTRRTPDSSLVLRLPLSPGVAEAGLLGLLFGAFACGAAVLIGRRRRRPTRTAPW